MSISSRSLFDMPALVTDPAVLCRTCYGRGVCSEYDLGRRSLAHSDRMAELHTCPHCLGTGRKPEALDE